MVRVIPPSRKTNSHTRVNDASRTLKRFYVAERQLIRLLAGWFIKTSPWEVKFQLAEDMWQTAQNADALRTRVLELRYPRRDVDKKYDPDVIAFTGELAKAATLREFIAGVYEVALPALVDDYNAYLRRTDPLDDAPTVYRLPHIVADKQTQIERMRPLAAALPGDERAVEQWCAYLRRYLASIGGFSGLGERSAAPTQHPCAGRPDYRVPANVRRDERFRPSLYHLPHENKYDKAGQKAWKRIEALDKRVAMQVWSAISHFNEIWAGEIPASVLVELNDQPWDFYLDLTRWIWDENRHSMMGYRALQGWGWDVPALIPYGNALYTALIAMPPAQRLALLYYYEEGLLRSGTKQTEIKILESAQDDGSTQDMDYDWADEAIHVGYGFKWLRHLLGDDNAGHAELKRLTDEARDVMAKFVVAHKDDPEAQLAPYFDRLYDVIAAMTFEIPDDGLNIHWAPVVADESVLEEL
ncbi:MAG TPA: hypothetical protein VMT34_11080 [Aggregatilineales bacterium]|nr:hypothetical protein [Aggregatilineales bacterium]